MFAYEIYYRLDDSEYFETASVTKEADSVEELLEVIQSIEKRHTIISIKNVSMGIQ